MGCFLKLMNVSLIDLLVSQQLIRLSGGFSVTNETTKTSWLFGEDPPCSVHLGGLKASELHKENGLNEIHICSDDGRAEECIVSVSFKSYRSDGGRTYCSILQI